MDDSRIQLDLSISPEVLLQLTALEKDVGSVWTGALGEFRTGLDAMMLFGALGMGLYATSRFLYGIYWALDATQASTRWKQLAALTVGSVLVGVGCHMALARGVADSLVCTRETS